MNSLLRGPYNNDEYRKVILLLSPEQDPRRSHTAQADKEAA